jgi:hypothetical protein
MIDEAKLNSLLDEFDSEYKSSQGMGAAAGNPCAVWKNLRPIVVKLIGVLNGLALLFPKAKLAATALDALRGLLDTLCGTQLAPAASESREDPLVAQLAVALQPQAARSAPLDSPCETWGRVRPIVDDAIASLRALAHELPWLSKVADALQDLEKLLDAMCGTAPPPPPAQGAATFGGPPDAPGGAPAAAAISAWEDEPYLIAIGIGPPTPARPILLAVPVNGQPLLKTQISVPQPVAKPYPLGTAEFRYWNADAALARGINLWGPILPTGTLWSTAHQPMQVALDRGLDFNAFYARDTGLNFFHGVVDKVKPNVTAYSGESPHVVCHELGHAILDAVKPELFDAMSTEIAAFHEAFGDMSSTLSALQLPSVRKIILEETGGVLNTNSRLSQLARQLGWAIRVEFGPSSVDNDCLRNTANNFFYRDPADLPPSAPASSLSSEPHSFSRVFSGAFLDVLAGMFTIGPSSPAADPSSALAAVALDAGALLIGGIRLATVGPNFYSQVAAGMVQTDKTLHGGRYGSALVSSFVKRGILDASSAVALLRNLGEPGGSRTFGVISNLADLKHMHFEGDNEGHLRTGPNVPHLPLSPITTRFGLTLHVHLPAESKRFDVMAAAVTGGPDSGRSPETEAKAFIEDLIQNGRVLQGGAASAVPMEMFGPISTERDSRKTHIIVSDDGKLVLKRRHFDCQFGCC